MSGHKKLQARFKKPKKWQWGDFANKRNETVRYGFLKAANPKATIIFVPGLSEYSEKTFELSRYFNKQSCDFWTYDRHGQGYSGRFIKGKQAQHSQGFDHDVKDLVKLVNDVIKPDNPVIILGNSTGGMITLMAGHDHPDKFDAIISTSPLLGFYDQTFRRLGNIVTKIPMPKYLEEKPTRGNGSWAPRSSKETQHDPDDYSSDPVRNKIHDHWMKKDPELRAGAPTLGWGRHAIQAHKRIKNPRYLRNIKRPVLIFTAGKDLLVDNEPVFEAAKHIKDVEHIHFKRGKHELLMETDDIRDVVLDKTMRLVNKVCKNKPSP
jgi:lysophospholipase